MTAPLLSPAQTTDVPLAFDEAASTYDLMVRLNPGYHRHLRAAARALLERLPRRPGQPLRLADLGCGSGASTVALVRAVTGSGQPYTLVGVDASEQMLVQARAKVWPAEVGFVHGRAEDLSERRAVWGLADPVDGVFAA